MFNVLRSHQTAHHRVGVGLNLPWQVGLLVGDYLGSAYADSNYDGSTNILWKASKMHHLHFSFL